MKIKGLSGIVGVVVIGLSAAASSISTGTTFSITLTDGNYDPSDLCEGGITPGGTWLFSLSSLSPNNAYTQQLLQALNGQHSTNNDDPGYTIEYSYNVATTSLAGTLLIDWYKAFDNEVGDRCYHGAEIVAYYDFAEGEEALNLDWIQIYDESDGSVNSPYEYTVDGAYDQSPAYYAPGYGPWSPPGYTLLGGHDMTWSDGPYDSHIEADPWSGSVEFYMFLAAFGDPYPDSFEPTTLHQEITIYDGIVWGYTGICQPVPEPGTAVLFGFGIVLWRTARKLAAHS